jgi:N6-L-threonylcarbamoyladenine synthase
VLGGRWGFSFSGLKTAVAGQRRERPELRAEDVAAAFQAAVVDVLVGKTMDAAAAHGARTVLACGGVAANGALRAALGSACAAAGLDFRVPPRQYCTDNAAMVGAAGWAALAASGPSAWDLDADPNLPLEL